MTPVVSDFCLVDCASMILTAASIALACALFAIGVGCQTEAPAKAEKNPNIVVILADDMGYGDVQSFNSRSRISTPHLDGLAAEGMTFTDAHTPSSVCTPTRYGLLTGRYCWRTRLKRGVLGGYSPPLIDRERATLASMLKRSGYHTGAVGKWHLGMNPSFSEPEQADRSMWQGDPGVDFGETIADAPTTRGFDSYFGVSASLDMAPYVFVRNNRFTAQPVLLQELVPFPHFIRAGPRAQDFVVDEVLDTLTEEAIDFVRRGAEEGDPFFLYFPLTAPHKPTQPHRRFRGSTDLGEYGDFVAQVDWTVEQVLGALAEVGAADNTLVIFTSDNGSYMFGSSDPTGKDHVDDPTVQAYRTNRHRANGPLRGTKADIWEGGHRVPFLARWPGVIESGSRCEQTIALTDLFATCAEIVGVGLEADTAEDSFSLLPALRGEEGPRGAPVIHHSYAGMFAIRDGRWKLVLGNGSGGREQPLGEPFAQPYQLFDLAQDISEKSNLAQSHPDVVKRMLAQFEQIRESGRSRP